MKWIFIAGLMVFTPAAIAFLRANPKYLLHACFLLGVAIFFQNPWFSVSPIFWDWPGEVQGLQVSFVDALATAMIFSTRPIKIPLPLKGAFAVYVLGLFVSSFAAPQVMPVVFYVWQLFRAILVFMAVARVTARHDNGALALAAGLGLSISIEALLVAKEFVGGTSQPGGTLGHRNILGMTSHFATMPAFALLLAGYRSRLALLVVLSGIIIALLGGSRATIGLLAGGMFLTTLLSMRHRMAGRKSAIAAAGALCLLVAAPVMLWAINRRTDAALSSSDAERSAMIAAARMIIADHPLGVGGNFYVVTANVGGYSERAGVPWNADDRVAPVHNSYFLVTAELGWIGLIGFSLIFLAIIATGWRALRKGVGARSELLVGFLGATFIVAAHAGFEWVFETALLQYLTACMFGTVVGIAASVRRTRGVPPKCTRRLPASHLVPESA